MKLNVGTLAVIFIGAVVFGYWTFRFPPAPHRTIGLLIVAISLPFLVIARVQLGRAFSVQARASELVTTGLYSRIRNPIYVFSSLVFVGLIVWWGNPWYFLVFAVIIPVQFIRARKESQVLREKFGAAYDEYSRKTWF